MFGMPSRFAILRATKHFKVHRTYDTCTDIKYTPTQLGVTGCLLPKTICDAPPNTEVNRRRRRRKTITDLH